MKPKNTRRTSPSAVTFTLDGVGNVLTSTDPAGYTTEYVYDGANRVTQVIQQITLDPPTYEPTGYTYDPNGRLLTVLFANSSTRDTAYDLAGQVTKTAGGPDGGKHFVYESMGRLSTVTDAENRVKQYFYDDLGRLTQELDPLTNPTDYLYDIAGRRTAIIDANGNQTNYVYNDDSQVTQLTYPLVGQSANVETYIYSAETGQLRTKTTPNNVDIEYLYEPDGQLASEGGVNYDYDPAGALTDDGVMTFAYDSFGHRTSATSASLSRTIAYQYDLRGLRTRLEVGGVVTIAYALDGAGRLTSVQKGTDAPATYHYDATRRLTLALPNGVVTSYGYDTSDRLTSISTVKDSITLASFAYTVDDTDFPTNVTQVLQTWTGSQWGLVTKTITYTPDDARRLVQETQSGTPGYSETFVYDPVGNRTSRTLNGVTTTNYFSARNQITKSSTNSVDALFYYDKNGNTLTSTAGGVTKSMAYDKFNRQTSWTDATNSEATAFGGAKWHRTSYAASGAGATYFLYDGDNVLADFVEDPQNQGSYLAMGIYVTPFLDENLSMTILSGEQAGTYHYSQDRLSVVTLTNSAGAMVNAYDLTAMGEKLPSTHETVAQRYTYTGREFNAESGDYYFRYRVYGPALGQFFTRDPLGYEDGMGLYGGVFAQRQGMDPTGRKGDLPPGGQAPQGQNCFGYCFGLNEWWGERVNAYTFVILEKENGNILGKKVVPLCEQGKRQQEAVTTKAKALKFSEETANTDCCCGKDKICVYTDKTDCMDMPFDEMKKRLVQDPNGVQYAEITLAEYDRIFSRVDWPQHCMKCSYADATPVGEPRNWWEKMAAGPVQEFQGSTLNAVRGNWKLWKCWESKASAAIACKKKP